MSPLLAYNSKSILPTSDSFPLIMSHNVHPWNNSFLSLASLAKRINNYQMFPGLYNEKYTSYDCSHTVKSYTCLAHLLTHTHTRKESIDIYQISQSLGIITEEIKSLLRRLIIARLSLGRIVFIERNNNLVFEDVFCLSLRGMNELDKRLCCH